MDTIRCAKCGKVLTEDTVFCSGCGTKNIYHEVNCPSCGKNNEANSQFCKKCGTKFLTEISGNTSVAEVSSSSMDSSQYFYHKIALAVLVVLLLSFSGAYYYYNSTNEDRYLTKYAEAARKISATHDVLASNITVEKLKKPEQIKNVLDIIKQQKNNMEELEKNFSEQKSIDKYAEQHKNMTALLVNENSMLRQINLIISNPLNAEADTMLTGVKTNVEESKKIASQIQVPNATISFSGDMLVLSNQLTLFVEEKRKANKEKLDRLQALNEFFTKFDNILQRYNGAKTDLGGMLDNIRKGGYTWQNYFRSLEEAKSFRVGLRYQVDNINAPKNTEDLKRQLSEVLTLAINYCEVMNAAAKVEYDTNYNFTKNKYDEAGKINEKVQTSYEAFINQYQTEKTRLTNIDNL